MRTSLLVGLLWLAGCEPVDGECWDVDMDAECSESEDLNGDGDCNALDCVAEPGLSCWDLSEDGVCDRDEDADSDGVCTVDDCLGPAGEAGPAGNDGAAGATGEPGPMGAPGADGTSCTVSDTGDGVLIQCDDGTQASVSDGDNGAPGQDGTPGPTGEPGLDGSSCSVTATATGALIACSDGTSAAVENGVDGGGGASPVVVAAANDQLQSTDTNVFVSEAGRYLLPEAPVDGQVLRVAFNSGIGVTLDPGSVGIRGLGKAQASGVYAIATSDPGVLTLLYVANQSAWYVNAL